MQDTINLMIFLFAMLIIFTVAVKLELDEKEQTKDTCGFETKIEYEATKRLHYYHGTLTSYIENGTWLFLRDGRVCSLYDPLTRIDK